MSEREDVFAVFLHSRIFVLYGPTMSVCQKVRSKGVHYIAFSVSPDLDVMIDLLLLVVGHWGSRGEFKRRQITMRRAWTQRVNSMTRTSSTMTREWSRSMMMSCTAFGVEQEGKLQMDSLRDCLSYCSSIYTFYKYVLVWQYQR